MVYDPVQALLDELVRERVVVVVGSGFTIASTGADACASWPDLIRHGASYAVAQHLLNPEDFEEIQAQLAAGDAATLIAAAERVEHALKSRTGTFDRWLQE